tara:strand:+ start:293 stop:541 length:249 start_codon:yes stop_codon:yes gene_type:complete
MAKIIKFTENIDTEVKKLLQEIVDFSEVLDEQKHEDFYSLIQEIVNIIPDISHSMSDLEDKVLHTREVLNKVGLMIEEKGSV